MTGLFKRVWQSLLAIFFIVGTVYAEDTLKPSINIAQATQEQRALGCSDYVVHFDHFPKHQDIQVLFTRVIKGDPQAYRKVEQLRIDDTGCVEINGKKFLFYSLPSSGFAYGEKVKYRFELSDGTLLAEANYIPKPIRLASQEGTFFLEAVLVEMKPTTYCFYFNGLNENESLHLSSISDPEVIESDFMYHLNDATLFLPGVFGKNGGKAAVKIIRQSGDTIVCSLPWGADIIQELLNELNVVNRIPSS